MNPENQEILHFAKGPEKMLYHSISDEENPTSIVKKLFDAIEECKSPIKSINRVTELDNQLSKEIDLFTSGGVRGEYLQAAYLHLHLHSYLGTILPTTVDCVRYFSTAPYVDYKIRSDDMLDASIFLKNYLKQLYTYFGIQIIFLKANVFVYT